MKKGKGRGKEREAPTHLVKNSKLTHAGCVTKNKHGYWDAVDATHAWAAHARVSKSVVSKYCRASME